MHQPHFSRSPRNDFFLLHILTDRNRSSRPGACAYSSIREESRRPKSILISILRNRSCAALQVICRSAMDPCRAVCLGAGARLQAQPERRGRSAPGRAIGRTRSRIASPSRRAAAATSTSTFGVGAPVCLAPLTGSVSATRTEPRPISRIAKAATERRTIRRIAFPNPAHPARARQRRMTPGSRCGPGRGTLPLGWSPNDGIMGQFQ